MNYCIFQTKILLQRQKGHTVEKSKLHKFMKEKEKPLIEWVCL